MLSLRNPVCQLFARVLIAALVVTSLPPLAAVSHARTLLPGHIHADGIGSIRRLTDEAGLITDGYTYTAFGELIAHTGTDPQPYAFAGEPYDPNSGFQYHRARWMDPRSGRFLGMDPFEGLEEDPASLHKYLYAHVSPVSAIDPSGRITLTSALTRVAMTMTMFTIAHPYLTAAIGLVGAALIPEEVQNAMMASGMPGVAPIGAVGRSEARGIALIKNWASQRFAARELGSISGGIGAAFETFAKRHLFKGAIGPIPVGSGRQSLDLLWRNLLIELKTSRRLEPDDLLQLAAGAETARQNGYQLTYVFLYRPTKAAADAIRAAGGREFSVFPW